jgi:nucleoside-diphosphate-sugar epimerase
VGKLVLVLGGTGQIGRAVARRFAEAGWEVAAAARGSAPAPPDLKKLGVRIAEVDRASTDQLAQALGDGVDVLVDVVPFTAGDARQLSGLVDRIGSIVAVSTAGVYADEAGRSFDTQAEAFPHYPVPITERQPTVAPGDETYHTRKVAMEQALLESRLPTTIVRPSAIQGPGSRVPRELHFVKRVLDGRRVVPLAHRGETRFHTTSVENLAELIWLAGERPGTRILNCGDPDPPTALGIARAVAATLGHEWAEVLLPGAPEGIVGDTPWTGEHPFVLDMLEAELELRYRPVTTYERSVPKLCQWLLEALKDRDWTEAFPEAVGYLGPMFDYAAEDEYLRNLGA